MLSAVEVLCGVALMVLPLMSLATGSAIGPAKRLSKPPRCYTIPGAVSPRAFMDKATV
jgi:hypothetical protein